MKILGSCWFTNRDGTTGIVKVETDYEGINYFIGHAPGIDEAQDAEYIAEWGSKFNYAVGTMLFK